jgi:hypothetical protein
MREKTEINNDIDTVRNSFQNDPSVYLLTAYSHSALLCGVVLVLIISTRIINIRVRVCLSLFMNSSFCFSFILKTFNYQLGVDWISRLSKFQ